jgi:predicted small secreted protein
MFLRILFSSLLFISPLFLFGQSHFKFIDKESNLEISGYDADVLLNGYLNYASLESGKNGVHFIRGTYRDVSPSAENKFFLSIDKRDYFPFWQEVDLNRTDTLIVLLERDPNFQDQEEGLFHTWGGTPIMREYYPKPFRKWEEIPQHVGEKIKAELIRRVGNQAFDKIYISTAHIFETKRLNELKIPNNYAPNTTSYRICFSFSDRENGIAQYTTESVFLDNGAVVVAPKFPQFMMWESEEKKSWTLKNQAEVRQKLIKEFGESFTQIQPRFEFYPRGNTFSWVFSNEIGKTSTGEIQSQEVYLDAISGEILAVFYDKKLVIAH